MGHHKSPLHDGVSALVLRSSRRWGHDGANPRPTTGCRNAATTARPLTGPVPPDLDFDPRHSTAAHHPEERMVSRAPPSRHRELFRHDQANRPWREPKRKNAT